MFNPNFITRIVTTIATVPFAFSSSLFAPEAKAMPSNCQQYSYGIVCAQSQGSKDLVGFQFTNGAEFIGEITCTESKFILHSGWKGNISKSFARKVAKTYCQGRGNMFTNA